MSSYIYMKILESQPRRYDRGIAMLSLGRSERVKRRLIADNIRPGDRVFELGVGTGTAAVLAARAGAEVLGIDVSAPMLAVAHEKVAAAGLNDRFELVEAGVSGMDELADGSFDVVMATLVFSELSIDEQEYAVHHAFRVLRVGGRLAIADEARPRRLADRLLHGAVRIPLLFVTFALTQTITHAVEGLPERIRRRGFRIETEERSAFDSFLYLIAVKESAA